MAAREVPSLFSFNRGVIDPLALARVDVRRTAIAAAIQQNYIPRVMGSMMLRPGLAYLGTTLANAAARFLPFVKNTVSSLALIEFTAGAMRVWLNDTPIQLTAVTTTIPDLILNFASWTNNSEAGATVAQTTSIAFTSNGFAAAILDVLINPGANANKEHTLSIVVGDSFFWTPTRVNPAQVHLIVGLSTTDNSYVDTMLDPGTHLISFTPTGNFNIRLSSIFNGVVRVESVSIFNNANVALQLTSPYQAADLPNLRMDQSADFVYISCAGFAPRTVQHRAAHSWSLCMYQPPDGPVKVVNTTGITISASGTTGEVTLTASRPIFYQQSTGSGAEGHTGTPWQIGSQGQQVIQNLAGQDQYTDYIEVFGVGVARKFTINLTSLSGTGTTVTLQRSFGVPGTWLDATAYTANEVNLGYQDGLDNQIVFYRFGIKHGNWVAGNIQAQLFLPGGTITGTVLIKTATNGVAASTTTTATVVKALGAQNTPTTLWSSPQWSGQNGWPTAVVLFEGRLWWAGQNGLFGSVSDAFSSFDSTLVGDAGPIQRTIGAGPVDIINWLLPLQRLLLGAQGSEWSGRSSALDTPITPADFLLRNIGGQGSTSLPAVKVDQMGVFVNSTGCRAHMLEFTSPYAFIDYAESDLTALCPRILSPGVVRMAVQRHPDTRIHFVRSDGTVVLCVFDKVEQVQAFVTVVTNGTVEDVVILPNQVGNLDDQVYYVVKRTINGATVRYLEKWAQETECFGDQSLCKLADSHVVYSGAPATIINAAHLVGQQVVVWADGADVGTNDSLLPWTQRYTVDVNGHVTLPQAASNVVVGLPYTAQFQSAKLGLAVGSNSPLNRLKSISRIGLVAANIHPKGLQYSEDGAYWNDMPAIERGTTVGTAVRSSYDETSFEFPGVDYNADQRVWLQSFAPRPCTVMALTPVISISTP